MAEISVLMATHNDEAFIEEAIASILGQSFSDIVFIIVDDASTDGTLKVLEAAARVDSRVRVLSLTVNVGLAAALNIGLTQVATPFIARMDGDDVSQISRLAVQYEFLKQNPQIDIVGTFAKDIDETGVPTGRIRRMPIAPTDVKRLVWSDPLIHPSVMFRTESLIRLGGYNPKLRRRQDYELWFRAVKAGLVIANIPEILLHYRVKSKVDHTDIRKMWHQSLIGWRGCWSVKARPVAYFGVAFPLLAALVPRIFRRRFRLLFTFLDPRLK